MCLEGNINRIDVKNMNIETHCSLFAELAMQGLESINRLMYTFKNHWRSYIYIHRDH